MKKFKNVSVISVFLVLVLLLAGCGGEWYIKYNGESVSEEILTYYVIKAYDQAEEEKDEQVRNILETTVNGQAAEQWIADRAIERCKYYFIINDQFEKNGLSLSSEDNEEIEQRVYENYWLRGYREAYGPLGVDEDCYTEVMTNELKGEKLAEYLEDDLLDRITDDDRKGFLADNYASFIYISVAYYDEQGEEQNELYEDLCKQIETGTSIEDLATALDDQKSSVLSTSYENGRYDIAIEKTETGFPVRFRKELFEREIGETFYFDDSSNKTFNIAKRTDVLEDTYYMEMFEDEIKEGLLLVKLNDFLAELKEEYDFKVSQNNLDKISVNEILQK